MKTAIWFLLAASASAQPHCVVGGVITDSVTDKPVGGVRVFLTPHSSRPLPAILDRTNEQGAFCFAQVDPGDYVLRTQRAGYLDGEYGKGLILAVRRDAQVAPLAMKMIRRAILSGTVTDSDGEPLAGVEVSIYRRVPTHEDFDQDNMDSQQTDDRGTFRFADLPPGTYYLGTNLRDGAGFDRENRLVDSAGKPVQEGYIETFYSAATRFADANPIVLVAGKDTAGILMAMRKVQLHHISGKVSGAPPGTGLQIRHPNGNTLGGPAGPDATFYFGGLEPGVYSVELRTGNQILARKEVVVATSDVEGLAMSPDQTQPLLLTVALEFRTEGLGLPYRPRANAFAFLQRVGSEGGSIAQANPEGVLQFRNVEPGLYTLVDFGMDEEYYVKRILLGGKAITGRSMDLRNGDPGGIQIVLGRKSASLAGHISGEGVLTQAVTLLLVDEARGHTEEHALADQNRQFHMERVAAGKYRLYAVEQYDEGVWNADLAKSLLPKSIEVELGDSDAKSVELPLISAREFAAAVK